MSYPYHIREGKKKSMLKTYRHFVVHITLSPEKAHQDNFNVTAKDYMTVLKEVAHVIRVMTHKAN
jgi:hypothetical protein